MKRTAISRKPSPKQAEREVQRKKVVAELKEELGDVCEVCKELKMSGFDPDWLPIVGHEIVFRSKGVKSCKMDRTNIILVGFLHHEIAHTPEYPPEFYQAIVDKRNSFKLIDK